MSFNIISQALRSTPDRFLFAYTGAHTRASEAAAVDPRNGWLWYSTTTPWPATNVARVLSSGEIFIEGASTNRVLQSSDLSASPWGGTGTTTTGKTDPTGATGACRYACSTAQERDQAYASDVAAARITTGYLQQGAGSGYYAFYAIRSGSNGTEVHGTATTSWARYETDNGTTRGSNPEQVSRVVFDGRGSAAQAFGGPATAIDVNIFNLQAEDGAFASSPIRTTVAEVTRSADIHVITSTAVPSVFRSTGFTVDVWPIYSSGTAPATAYIYYYDASNYLALISGTTLRMRRGGTNKDITGLSYSKMDKLSIIVNWTGNMTALVNGTVSSSVVISGSSWSGMSGTNLNVGSDGANNQLFGVISKPARLFSGAPSNTVAPVASGTVAVGNVLSVTTGTWVGSPSPTFSYQWQRGGANIGSATASTYTVVGADVGPNITCNVTATNVKGSSTTTSNTLVYDPVADTNVLEVVDPSVIPGTTFVSFLGLKGRTVSVDTGTGKASATGFNGTPSLTADGSNTLKFNIDLSGINKTDVIVGLTDSNATVSVVYSIASGFTNLTNDSFAYEVLINAGDWRGCTETLASPCIMTVRWDRTVAFGVGSSGVRKNGVAQTLSDHNSGTIPGGNLPNGTLFLFNRADHALPWTGTMGVMVITNGQLSANALATVEAYVNFKSGTIF